MSDRLKLRKPTAEEVSAVHSSSSATEFVELHKPTYDFLKSCLQSDDAVSRYVSNRITAEIVRLSKLHKPPASKAGVKRPNKAQDWERWREAHNRTKGDGKRDTVRVRAYPNAHATFLSLSPNRIKRVSLCGAAIAQSAQNIDRSALADYCASHYGKPRCFITVPREAIAALETIARVENEPMTKIVSFVIESLQSHNPHFVQ